jgi:hypothetical protein
MAITVDANQVGAYLGRTEVWRAIGRTRARLALAGTENGLKIK